MRSIAWAMLALIGLGSLASAVPLAPPEHIRSTAPPWRRTVDGWQRAYWLVEQSDAIRPAVHPLAFGIFLLTAAVAVPIALSKPGSSESAEGTGGIGPPHPCSRPGARTKRLGSYATRSGRTV